MMKKGLLSFEEAHTLVLCLIYLPIPEFVVMILFDRGLVCSVMTGLMVLEIVMAVVIYLGWHKCPQCTKMVAQFHIHKDCNCHHCGYRLLREEDILQTIPVTETAKNREIQQPENVQTVS